MDKIPTERDGGSEFVRIRISKTSYERLSKWASVGRSIDAAVRLISDQHDELNRLPNDDKLASLEEQMNHTLGELIDLKAALSECGSACVSARIEVGSGRMLHHPLVLLAEAAAALREVAPSVLGLPCFCRTPELHADPCARVRQLISRIEYVLTPSGWNKSSNPLTESFGLPERDPRSQAEELFCRLDRTHAAQDAIDMIEAALRGEKA